MVLAVININDAGIQIGLDGDLGPGNRPAGRGKQAEQPPQTIRAEVGRRPTSQIERVELERLLQPLKLAADGRNIGRQQIIPPRHQRKVAITTPVPAEGDMNVGVANRAHSHTCSLPSSRSGSFLARIRRMRSSVYRVE